MLMEALWRAEWWLRGKVPQKEHYMDRPSSDMLRTKVGDRIEVVKYRTMGDKDCKGCTGVVDNVGHLDGATRCWATLEGGRYIFMATDLGEEWEILPSHKEATMSDTRKFKVGDKVKLVGGSYCITTRGMTGKVISIGSYVLVSFDQLGGDNYSINPVHLQLLAKTFDNLEEGDILIQEDGDEVMVLGVAGKAVFISQDTTDKRANSCPFTAKELQEDGWEIKGTEEDVVEVTVSELSKKHFGGKVVKIIEE